MSVSFKQFSNFLAQSRGEDAPEKLDEIFGKIFGKEEDKEAKKNQVLTAKELLAKKKEKEEQRKKDLQKKRDDDWLKAKERTERGPSRGYPTGGRSDRDDYALHRQMKENLLLVVTEGRSTYTEQGAWKEAAKAAGYDVKKLSGNIQDGDQTWCAYDEDDNKMGEFTENKDGWLSEDLQEADERNKHPGFFTMSDADKVLRLDLDAAKKHLSDKIERSSTGASSANIHKAKKMVGQAPNVKKLALAVSDFVLAHESGKNKVIR